LVFLIILAIILFRIRKTPGRAHNGSLGEKRSSDTATAPEAGLVDHNHNHQGEGGHTYTRTFLWVLVISSLLIFARTLYRLAETAEGEPRPGQSWVLKLIDAHHVLRISGVWGNASSIEALFGVFEFAPVVIAAWIWLARPLRREMIRMS
jgi:hypothetical protein